MKTTTLQCDSREGNNIVLSRHRAGARKETQSGIGSKLSTLLGFSSVSTAAIYELEDALWDPDGSPDAVIALIRKRPALARALVNEDTWQEGELPIWHLLNMKKVKLMHVQELYQWMKKQLPQGLLHHACKLGCDNDIVIFITEHNRKASRTKDFDGHLPIYHLIGSCDQSHLPALRLLLNLSSSQVKREIPKYIRKVLSNQDCPREIIDDLTNLTQV